MSTQDPTATKPQVIQLTKDQKEELDRRMAEHRTAPGSPSPLKEVRERLRRRFS